jgi:hypothetical protein
MKVLGYLAHAGTYITKFSQQLKERFGHGDIERLRRGKLDCHFGHMLWTAFAARRRLGHLILSVGTKLKIWGFECF